MAAVERFEVAVRVATSGDEPAIVQVDLATWSPAVSPTAAPTVDDPFFGPAREPEDVLVAVVDGAVAGYVHVGIEFPIPSNVHVMALRGLAVDPAHQGLGIGRQLIGAAVDELAARGATRIRSRVLGTNAASLAVHRACGFEVEGVLRGEFVIAGTPVDDVLLARVLPDA